MANHYDSLKALFLDVYYDGAVVIDKRKLLGLMGKGQDRPTAWELLLSIWEDCGYLPEKLVGAEYDRNVILVYGNDLSFEKVADWAGREA